MAKGATIRLLVDRAFRKDYAKLNRRGTTVYEVIKDDTVYILKHYGTTTVVYDTEQQELLSWYGESVSDRDSMNAFLRCLGDERFYFRYGPVMGFLMEDHWEDEVYEVAI